MRDMPFLKALRRTALFRARSALGLAILPMKLRLAVTNRCNARCTMCNAWKRQTDGKDELTVDEYGRIFERNRSFFSALRHVSLTGGEPLLREDLEEIVRVIHGSDPRLTININTNGFRTDRLIALARSLASADGVGRMDRVHESGIVVTYNVSLDALGEIHDRMRGVPRASDMAKRSIQELARLKGAGRRLRIGVNYMVTEENHLDCGKVYDFCRENGVAFNPIMPMTGEIYDNEGASFHLSPEARKRLRAEFERFLGENPKEWLVYSEILRQLDQEPRDFRCWAGRIIFLIEENGEVYPNGGCPRRWVLGNLRDFDYRLDRLVATDQARQVLENARQCRACRLACETLTTLRHPEALAARRKMRTLPRRAG
jgi:MoaA/NifB/PqqE/SkfB family radical SAM enzyme